MALRLRPVRRADLGTLERWWGDPEAQGRHSWFGFSPDGELRRRFEQARRPTVTAMRDTCRVGIERAEGNER
jgi:hypothetical protein